jgi:hypothetical protein
MDRCAAPPARSKERERSDDGAQARVPFVIIVALVATAAVRAQQSQLPISDGQVLRLWEGSAPGALGSEESDIPVLTVYLAARPARIGNMGFSAGPATR